MEGAVHATLFIDVLAVGLVVPLLPFKADELHLSSLSFGLLTSLYGVAQLIGGIIVGVLADRFLGRKLALMISLLVSACGYLLLMSTSTVQMFALSRIVVGSVRHSQALAQAMVSQNASAPSMALARLGYACVASLPRLDTVLQSSDCTSVDVRHGAERPAGQHALRTPGARDDRRVAPRLRRRVRSVGSEGDAHT